MSCFFYELYQERCNELELIMKQNGGGSNEAKKLRGALAVKLLKQEIDKYLVTKEKPIKVSELNTYIAGSKYEYDLLLVKEDAQPYMDLVYNPEDVIAIIESKVNGLYDISENTNSIAIAVNRALEINSDIKFGYITMGENVPVNKYNRCGKPTVRHWDLTQEYLEKKIKGYNISYAVTLYQGKKLCDEGKDEEFYGFIECLIKNDAK